MHPSPRSRTRTRLVVLAVALVLFGAAVWIGAAVGHREPSRGLRGGANGMLGFVRATVTSTGFGIGAPTHFEQSLNTVTLTGTGERVLSRGQDDVWYGRATWSPDGQQAAFATWVQTRGPGAVLGGARVQVLDVPTGKVRTIWTCPGGKCPHELQWSPDGQVIAYSLSRWIGLIRPDGRPVRRVFTCETDACQSLDEGLSWAPDGSRLAFSATSGDEVGGIFTIEPNGSGLRQITKCFTTECGFGGDSFPAWSPDGSVIGFVRGASLYEVGAEGGTPRRLVSCADERSCLGQRISSLAWSPDGTRLAYASTDGLHVVRRDGSGAATLIAVTEQGHAVCCVSWQPLAGPAPILKPPASPSPWPVAGGPLPSPSAGVPGPEDWAQYRGSAGRTGSNGPPGVASTGMSEPRPLWASTISNEVVAANSPVVAGGQAYLGAFDGNLYAFQADGCGAARCPPEWWGRTGGAIRNTPAVGDGSVFVGSDVLYAFPASGCGRRTCRPSWVGETQTRIRYSSPVVAGGRVYVASSWPQETLYAFRSRGCGAATCPPEWTSTGLGGAGGIFSSPAVSGGFVFLQADTRLVAFQAAGCGSKICPPAWTGDTRTETESSSTPAVSDRKVYIGGGDCQAGSCGVWVFDAKGCGDEQCEPLWRGVTKGGIDASPTVGSGRVYIPAEDGRLYAFDAAGCGGLECQPLWTARVGPPGSFPTDPALASGLVVVRSEPERGGDGTLYAFPADGCGDRACGPLWSLVLHDAGHSSPAITGDAMFVSAGDGIVRAYRLA